MVLQYEINPPVEWKHIQRMTLVAPVAQQSPPDVVDTFTGEYSFLSSFHEHSFMWCDRRATSLAHHYAAARVADPAARAAIYEQPTAGKATRVGQRHRARQGWDEHLKLDCMRSLIAAKFAPGSVLAQKLLGTGHALLLEGNTWHDMYWGQCTCERHYHWPGANTHGRLLMEHRSALRNGDAPLTRVAVTGHRPQSLAPQEQGWISSVLPALMRDLREHHGMQVAISGMALGTDTIWAQAAVDQHLSLWGYIPSPDQPSRWGTREQQRYTDLLAKASLVRAHGASYDGRWIKARNDAMVRDCNALVAVHKEDKHTGGTAAVIRKARSCQRPLIRVNITRRLVTSLTAEGEQVWPL